MTLNQGFGYVFGAIYALVGLLGFTVTGGVEFAGNQGEQLIGFELNPLHNIVHIAIGALLIAGAAGGLRASRMTNGSVGAAYLLVGILGIFMVNEDWDFLALNQADNVLHFATAVIALAIALWADKREPARA
ncbi:MAG TPA: DUF4383 domain-containing protein [Actinomycetota bacterium]